MPEEKQGALSWAVKNWRVLALIAGAVGVVILIVIGWDLLAAVFGGIAALFGFGKKGRNTVPRGRDEAIGERDDEGFKQLGQEVSDDPADGAKLPDGVGEGDVDALIETDPTVEVKDNADPRSTAKENREMLKKKLGQLAVLFVAVMLSVSAMADDICLTPEEAKGIDYDLMLLQSVQEGSPQVDIKEAPTFVVDDVGRVFSNDRLILRVFQPAIEGDELVYDRTLLIDLNARVKSVERKPSWWEENDFKIGVVGGVVVTVGIGAALFVLAN